MAVSDHWHRVSKVRATIMAVDPANNIIDVRRGDGGSQRIMVWEIPASFIWPMDGEDWSIYEQNGSWYLGDRINSPIDSIPVQTLQPGDQRLGGERTIAREIQVQADGDAMLNLYDTSGPVDGKRSRLVNQRGFTSLQAADDAYDDILNTGFKYNHATGHVVFENGATTDVSLSEDEAEPYVPVGGTQVRSVGAANQVRAGRQLDWSYDFLESSLDIPNIWNLGGVSSFDGSLTHIGVDSSVTQHHLTNRGSVLPAFGITGETGTAGAFDGSSGSALYWVYSAGAGWSLLSYGSAGCWFKTPRRGTLQALMSEWRLTANGRTWYLGVGSDNRIIAKGSTTGNNEIVVGGGPDVADDRWHFAVVSHDGSYLRIYVDSYQVGSVLLEGPLYTATPSPFNIGGYGAASDTVPTDPFLGTIDEAFRIRTVLSADQVRYLYAAKMPHRLSVTPTRVSVGVQSRPRGSSPNINEFPTPPKYYYRQWLGAGSTNEGTGAGSIGGFAVPGMDPLGSDTHGEYYNGVSYYNTISAPSSDIPYSTTARSAGCWLKTNITAPHAGSYGLICLEGIDLRYLYLDGGTKQISIYDTANVVQGGPMLADGFWHHAVSVSDNSASDGLRHKLYLDGKLVASSTASMPTTGAPTGLLVGRTFYTTEFFPGMIAGGLFLCNYALSVKDIRNIYDYGGEFTGGPSSPKNPGDHIVAIRDDSLLVDFSTLSECDYASVRVAA